MQSCQIFAFKKMAGILFALLKALKYLKYIRKVINTKMTLKNHEYKSKHFEFLAIGQYRIILSKCNKSCHFHNACSSQGQNSL